MTDDAERVIRIEAQATASIRMILSNARIRRPAVNGVANHSSDLLRAMTLESL